FEEMVSVLVRDAGPVVGNAEIGSTAASTDCHVDAALGRRRVDRVVDQVGNHFSKEEGIGPHLHLIGRLAQCELNRFRPRTWPGHPECKGDELIEIDRLRREADAWSCALGKSPQDGGGIVCRGARSLYRLSV